MNDREHKWHKGDTVIVLSHGRLWLTKVTRRERNSDHVYHTESSYSTHEKYIFPASRQGTKEAYDAVIQQRKDTITNLEKALREAAEELNKVVTLTTDRTDFLSPYHVYEVDEKGNTKNIK